MSDKKQPPQQPTEAQSGGSKSVDHRTRQDNLTDGDRETEDKGPVASIGTRSDNKGASTETVFSAESSDGIDLSDNSES